MFASITPSYTRVEKNPAAHQPREELLEMRGWELLEPEKVKKTAQGRHG
jgi:hypothetical protein